jgi:hypothetical protein
MALPSDMSSSLLLVRPFAVPSGSSLLRLLRPLLTSRSGCPRRPFRRKARSPQVRTHSFTAQPPHLRRLTLGHKSFAVQPARPGRQRLVCGSCSSAHGFAPRFLPTLGHPHAVALHLPRCGQLGRGLAPRRVRPCWAHRLDHESFAVIGPLALLGSAFYPVLVHRLADYDPRFLLTLGRPNAVALHFVRCDQLTAGLTPAGVRPCWAHQ